MELIESKSFFIRNYRKGDLSSLNKLMLLETSSEDDRNEFLDNVSINFNADLNSEGEKMFAITNDNKLVGRLSVNLESPNIFISFKLYEKFDSRIFYQELVFVVVSYLHKLYSHRQIITYSSKFDLLRRSILENFGFKVNRIDKNSNMYEYTIFVANPNKD